MIGQRHGMKRHDIKRKDKKKIIEKDMAWKLTELTLKGMIMMATVLSPVYWR